ncbi:MAG: UDP-N-acetylglucosamine--N-acetylmuramyl-(pentapeptide) pyrophosphoryl-undecaprenol N-acetylglucosamine transferase [Opitutaceae bacterium]|nr:UDP-N-acetylglucosamine--N-acetylmuramyl-(pentapeptide) pyrophosphoryl-undecaprenol N-acetylglucosamine transferase [Opitutaceae bacterium]
MKRFLIACGGTGGHLSPGIALAEDLMARGHEVTLLISRKKVDTRLCEKYPHLAIARIPGAPFGWRPGVLARCIWGQSHSLVFSFRYLRQHRPDAIVGFGGFTNAGMVVAGRLLGIPVALHEANRVPGRAIRLLADLARRLYLPPGVRLPGIRGVLVRHTGLPVRREIRRLPRSEARQKLGVDPEQKLLVIFGGSQGSGPLNQWIEDNLAALAREGIQVYCVTGLGKGREGVREFPAQNGSVVRAWFVPFCDDVASLFSAADLVLSRAGAGTLAELVRCQTPALLVPYPQAADNHQLANARYFEQQGGGILIEQPALNTLKQEVLDMIFNDWLLNKFRGNLCRMSQETSSAVIVHDLEELTSATMSPDPRQSAAA